MKYFKYIGDNEFDPFEKDKVYKGSYKAKGWAKVSSVVFYNSNDWQEVPKPKKSLSEKIEKLKKQAEKEGMAISFHFEGVNDIGLDLTFNGICLTISPKPDPNKGIIYQPNTAGGTFTAANPKDEWEGVEYAECLESQVSCFTVGKIYRVNPSGKGVDVCDFLIDNNNYTNGFTGSNRTYFKPSTESAYVEQLKAKAKELLGEIKDQDVFDQPNGDKNNAIILNHPFNMDDLYYNKTEDTLRARRFLVYQQGKWAKKLPKRIEVDLVWDEKIMLGVEMPAVAFHDKTKYNSDGKVESIFTGKSDSEIGKSFKFLASQLEKYLNGEIE